MSVYSEITRIVGLRNRLKTKLYNLGLLKVKTAKLADCANAVDAIDEVTPYLISTAGIKNVAAYKYAQIDESAWVPAGTVPSRLESKATGLGADGIERTIPAHSRNIGTVYPSHGVSGMYANALFIDTDVIKPDNIKKGVKILGVDGSYEGSNIDYVDSGGFASADGGSLTIYDLPISDIFKIRYINITAVHFTPGALEAGDILNLSNEDNVGYPRVPLRGIKVNNNVFTGNFTWSLVQGQNGYDLTIDAISGTSFVWAESLVGSYLVHITYLND